MSLREKLFIHFCDFVEASLTIEYYYETENYIPLTEAEAFLFITMKKELIYDCVDKMINYFNEHDDITELEDPESDWIQEFITDQPLEVEIIKRITK